MSLICLLSHVHLSSFFIVLLVFSLVHFVFTHLVKLFSENSSSQRLRFMSCFVFLSLFDSSRSTSSSHEETAEVRERARDINRQRGNSLSLFTFQQPQPIVSSCRHDDHLSHTIVPEHRCPPVNHMQPPRQRAEKCLYCL